MADYETQASSVAGTLEIPLEYLKECFLYDNGVITWKARPEEHFASPAACAKWNGRYAGSPAGYTNSYGYCVVRLVRGPKQYHLKRGHIVLALHGLVGESGKVVDHINGNRLDDRIENLRQTTQPLNCINVKLSARNKYGHKGVRFHNGRWEAYIGLNKRTRHLGSFITKEEAIAARQQAEKDLFGEFNRSTEHL